MPGSGRKRRRRSANGRKQRRRSANGRIRRPDLSRFYRRKLRDVTPGEFSFECMLHRPEAPKRSQTVSLKRVTETIEWTDSRAPLTGLILLRRGESANPGTLPVIERGHRIRCIVTYGKRRVKLWDMRVEEEPPVDRASGTVTLTLADDLAGLKRSKRDWEYRKDNTHPKGWRAHEITEAVCRKLNVRPGRIARGTANIKKLKKDNASGLEVIKAAYKEESEETFRRYVIRIKDGRLHVEEYERSKVVYGIRNMETSATLQAESRKGRPQTVIKGTARINGKKETFTASRPAVVKRLGRVIREKNYGRLDSRKQLAEKCQRDLRKELKIKRTADVTIPGVPFLKRGSTVRYNTRERGWHGSTRASRDRQYAFVGECTHTVTGDSYDTSLRLTQRDPYLADKRRRQKTKRKEKRRKRKKK